MSMLQETLSDAEQKKVKRFIDEALSIFQQIDDQKGALSDLCKVTAEELGVKPAILMKSARTAFKNSLEDQREAQETIEELLVAAGRA